MVLRRYDVLCSTAPRPLRLSASRTPATVGTVGMTTGNCCVFWQVAMLTMNIEVWWVILPPIHCLQFLHLHLRFQVYHKLVNQVDCLYLISCRYYSLSCCSFYLNLNYCCSCCLSLNCCCSFYLSLNCCYYSCYLNCYYCSCYYCLNYCCWYSYWYWCWYLCLAFLLLTCRF